MDDLFDKTCGTCAYYIPLSGHPKFGACGQQLMKMKCCIDPCCDKYKQKEVPAPEPEECKYCKFYTEDNGRCHRYPPKWESGDDGYFYPSVNRRGWCGEFKRKE